LQGDNLVHSLKNDPNKVRGDTLEVRLRDITLVTYYRAIVHINDKKKMAKLIQDLNDKGVTFPTSWFE